uniref:Coronatine-insensitive protein 1 n=1 Tax=Ananas comosus var. bracteatus TaxID=296719 RepID=A0A6V7QTX9_ANACO
MLFPVEKSGDLPVVVYGLNAYSDSCESVFRICGPVHPSREGKERGKSAQGTQSHRSKIPCKLELCTSHPMEDDATTPSPPKPLITSADPGTTIHVGRGEDGSAKPNASSKQLGDIGCGAEPGDGVRGRPRDRAAASLVCRKWCGVDGATRKRVTVAFCYSATPDRLRRRFPCLESLKIKAKPRAAMFDLIPDDWGATPRPGSPTSPAPSNASPPSTCAAWSSPMLISPSSSGGGDPCSSRSSSIGAPASPPMPSPSSPDLAGIFFLLIKKNGPFSSTLCETSFARNNNVAPAQTQTQTQKLYHSSPPVLRLRTFFLEDSSIAEKGSEWLRELALNNAVLESLNFYLTELSSSPQDLVLLARNCRSLASLKIGECDVSDLVEFFRIATALQEFCGGVFDAPAGSADRYKNFRFPTSLRSLGLIYMGTNEVHTVLPCAGALSKLDLQYTFLSTEDHCQLIQRCPNLEILEVRDVIGDRGLEVVSRTCKRLRRLRVERGDDEQGGLEDEQGRVSHQGLTAISRGCPELQYLAIHVSDITNAALESVGTCSRNLSDFRLVLLDREENITELPLDNGVRAMLSGCFKLRRFALYLRPGGLSDVGLGYIGEYSANIRYMLLGKVGESDLGLEMFSRGCPNLQKLELRGCCFSERALALAVIQLSALKYLWVHGYSASPDGRELMAMARPFWNIEFIPPIIVSNAADDREPVQRIGLRYLRTVPLLVRGWIAQNL